MNNKIQHDNRISINPFDKFHENNQNTQKLSIFHHYQGFSESLINEDDNQQNLLKKFGGQLELLNINNHVINKRIQINKNQIEWENENEQKILESKQNSSQKQTKKQIYNINSATKLPFQLKRQKIKNKEIHNTPNQLSQKTLNTLKENINRQFPTEINREFTQNDQCTQIQEFDMTFNQSVQLYQNNNIPLKPIEMTSVKRKQIYNNYYEKIDPLESKYLPPNQRTHQNKANKETSQNNFKSVQIDRKRNLSLNQLQNQQKVSLNEYNLIQLQSIVNQQNQNKRKYIQQIQSAKVSPLNRIKANSQNIIMYQKNSKQSFKQKLNFVRNQENGQQYINQIDKLINQTKKINNNYLKNHKTQANSPKQENQQQFQLLNRNLLYLSTKRFKEIKQEVYNFQ